MNILFLILLVGLPWANFLFNKFDIWSAQGLFFQLGILIIFSCSFFLKPKSKEIRNYPLGTFVLWSGLITLFYWTIYMLKTKQYPIMIFLPFFNLLCVVLFYKLAVEYLTEKDIARILKGLSISVFVVLCYCILQILNLDQFYTAVYDKQGLALGTIGQDALVGTIGNATHLAGYLAICQPLFFKKNWFNGIALTILWFVIIMTKSASGLCVALAVLWFWLLLKKQYKWFLFIIIICLIPVTLYWQRIPEFIDPAGRLSIWKILLKIFKTRPITGWGLGMVRAMNIKEAGTWSHAHNEYLQVAVELGIVGLGIVVWGIVDYFRRFWKLRNDDLAIKMAEIFFGFCLLGLFLFPAHLFLMATIGILTYSGIYVLEANKL